MGAAKSGPVPFEIGGVKIKAGERRTVDLPLSLLSNHTPVTMPVHVVHGRRVGPAMFVSAAIHGDEINGVEIVRRLLASPLLKDLRGTLVAVPIVNVFGFVSHSRYLPDRRDLNRCFPGLSRGSLAAQLAHLFMTEIVDRCGYGIDLHTGAIHRTNLPQIRGDLADPEVRRLALAFGAPVVLNAALRDRSLRAAARDRGIPVLLYEAGEALRFDEAAIRLGTRGVVRVMRTLGLLRRQRKTADPLHPVIVGASYWLRAPAGGIVTRSLRLGQPVTPGEVVGAITDPFGEVEVPVRARYGGVAIGRSNLPVVNQGDALFHIGRVDDGESAVEKLLSFRARIAETDPVPQ